MHILKTIIILPFSLLLGIQPSFRGLERAAMLNGPIPMAFQHYIAAAYDIPLSHLNPQRGSYLIITPDNVETYLGELVIFKMSQGFNVYVKTLSETGATAEEVKGAIAEMLDNDPMLEYVLLIGDVDGAFVMPSFYYGSQHDVTDQKYTHLLGDDFIPDVFIGRYSIDAFQDLLVMIQKTIQYHREPLATDTDWLDKALVVAGNYSDTPPIPITPKWTSYWVRDLLLDAGYTQVDTVFYPPTPPQQGPALIQHYINAGVGVVNYRGWGDANGWHYPRFHVNDVSGLNNGSKTPVFTSFVCNANDFANNVDPCLGEALVRAGTPANPTGGVAIVGPSDLYTSTKYNNVINAYTFDAMLDDGIVELAPALHAGLVGLTHEFPNLNGSGEAQERYFHVYNILGDPSIAMHLTAPQELSIEATDLSLRDGYVEIVVTDPNGNAVQDGIVSIMGNDTILFKGNTDSNGKIIGSIKVGTLTSVDVYVNKNKFIQGHFELDISDTDVCLALIGYEFNDGNNNGIIEVGDLVDVFPIIKNLCSPTASINCTVNMDYSENCQIISSDFLIPALGTGDTALITTPISVRVNAKDSDYIKLNIVAETSSWSSNLAIPVVRPQLEIDIGTENLEPNTNFTPELMYHNYTSGSFDNLHCIITDLSNSISFLYADDSLIFAVYPFSSNMVTLNDHTGSIGDVSIGSDLTVNVLIYQDTITIYQSDYVLTIPSQTTLDPIPNTWYGYWAYDDTDVNYVQAPTFEWVELDPEHGGSSSTEYKLDDDGHVNIGLPFDFRYFGRTYSEMTISSNGWTSFELCAIDYFYNYTIPMAMGPKALLAPFWDDLEVINNDSISVFTKYDQDNGRFIIEWSRALNGYDEATEETFAIHLYDPTVLPTASGDGVIEFHYLEIADIDAEKNYATVGIEAHNKNEGIQYVFNNGYAPGAAELSNERAIRFTTEAPANYVAPLGTEEENLPTGFQLLPAYPNPFNPVTTVRYQLPIASDVKMTVYDILGREVAVLLHEQKNAGIHTIRWNGTNRFGQSVASGTYFVVMKTLNFNQIQKVLLIK